MKRLILVRHGKSSWEYEVGDKDRPLKERGINDARKVAKAFQFSMPEINAVFSSPANRALHTCLIFLRTLDYPFEDFRVDNNLYDFSGESVMTFVHGLDNTLETVMIFGHNYAFTNVANQWGSEAVGNVPTSGLVHLEFDVDTWDQISKGTTKKMLFPKQLNQ